MDKKKFYMTTAIAYTSGKPHIGNTYEIVLADSIARFKRQQGYDVFFQTGTDEHGQKIELKAEEKGVTPKAFVDEVSTEIKRIWDLMNTSYDKFIRTTDADHEKQVQKIFKKLYDKGDIYKGHYEGMYCTPCESFFTESQLVDGKCPDCGREVQPAKEEAYFFRMSKYADRLIEHINTHPEFIQPVSRKNEMMNNFLLPGLQDLCVSRTSFKWGIPVDFDPKHVVYVWLDALTNYITGIGYDCDGNSSEQFKKDWPADLHLIGKDIIRFHTIYWPIFLMALDLPLPKQVFGHPWLLQGDGKMSKSKGNVLYADELVDFFGVDAVRYFVLHEMPFENDGVISWELMVERMNSDLANTLGNLVNRTVSMSNKYFGGVVENKNVNEPVDEELKKVVLETPNKVIAKMEELWGADATNMNWSETYTALQQGTVDGQENPLPAIDAASVQEVQKYVSMWNANYDCLFFCINQDIYDSLTPEQQEVVDECGKLAVQYEREINRAGDDEILSRWQSKNGVEVIPYEDLDIDSFKAVVEPVTEWYIGELKKQGYKDAEELVAAFK